MLKKIAFLALCLVAVSGFGQAIQESWNIRNGGSASSVSTDAQGNVYHTYGVIGPDGMKIIQVKFDRNGVLLHNKLLPFNPTGDSFCDNMTSDAAGNTYGIGRINAPGSSNQELLVYSLDPEGNVRWVYTHNGAGVGQDKLLDLKVTGTTVTVTGFEFAGATLGNQAVIIQFNQTDGAVNWFKSFGTNGTDEVGKAIGIDPANGNTYLAYNVTPTSGPTVAKVAGYPPAAPANPFFDVAITVANETIESVDAEFFTPTTSGVKAFVVGGNFTGLDNDRDMGAVAIDPATGAVVLSKVINSSGNDSFAGLGSFEIGFALAGTRKADTPQSFIHFDVVSALSLAVIDSGSTNQVNSEMTGPPQVFEEFLLLPGAVGDAPNSDFYALQYNRQSFVFRDINVAQGGNDTIVDSTFDPFGNPILMTQEGSDKVLRRFYQGVTDINVPSNIYGGQFMTIEIEVSDPAPPGGKTVQLLAQNPQIFVMPSTVLIHPGQSTRTFQIQTNGVMSNQVLQIAAGMDNYPHLNDLIFVRRAVLDSLQIADSVIPSGTSTVGTVLLKGKAPLGNPLTINLNDGSDSIDLPSTVQVIGGQSSAGFVIQTHSVANSLSRSISASFNGLTSTKPLGLSPGLLDFTINPGNVQGGQDSVGTVHLRGPASVATVIDLSENTSALDVPDTVTVPIGQSTATFPIQTSNVQSSVTRLIQATLGERQEGGAISISPAPYLSGFTLAQNSVIGGNTVNGTVTLNTQAGAGGVQVSLSDNSGAITTPGSLTITNSTISGNFTVQTDGVAATATRQVTAGGGGVFITRNLTLQPATLTGATVTPNTVQGGNDTTGGAIFNGEVGPGGRTLSIQSSSVLLNMPDSVAVNGGTNGATFTIHTSPVATTTTRTFTITDGAVTKTGSVTLTP